MTELFSYSNKLTVAKSFYLFLNLKETNIFVINQKKFDSIICCRIKIKRQLVLCNCSMVVSQRSVEMLQRSGNDRILKK